MFKCILIIDLVSSDHDLNIYLIADVTHVAKPKHSYRVTKYDSDNNS